MNLNKSFVLGNLTRDPELRQTKSGQTVCSFSVATNRTWTDKSTGKKQEAVEFHNVVAWGRTGELVAQYMKKGSQILVEGRLQTTSWEGKTGAKQYKTEIVAENIQFGSRPRDDRPSAPSQDDRGGPFGGDPEEGRVEVKDIPF